MGVASVTPTLGRQKQEALKPKASLGYVMSEGQFELPSKNLSQ